MKVEGGVVGRYVHASPSDSGTAGRMVAIVGLSCSRGPLDGEVAGEAQHLGDQLAMHIVAMRPKYLSRASGTAHAASCMPLADTCIVFVTDQ